MAIKVSGTTVIDDSRNIQNVGIITATTINATTITGDGSGLTGAGSTVADDTSTNATFYPLFTQTTSGTVTDSKVSTTKLTFNPSSGTVSATTFSGALSGNSSTATTLESSRTIGGVSFDGSANIDLPGVNTSGNQDTSGNAATATTLETGRTINGVSFDGSANIVVNPTSGAYSNGQGAKVIQSGGSASGGSSGDIYYIY